MGGDVCAELGALGALVGDGFVSEGNGFCELIFRRSEDIFEAVTSILVRFSGCDVSPDSSGRLTCLDSRMPLYGDCGRESRLDEF